MTVLRTYILYFSVQFILFICDLFKEFLNISEYT